MTIEQFKNKFGIIGKTKEINDLVDVSMQVAKSDISVLITGESGVGKEVFARAIHGYSNRSDKQLVSVNCGAIPEGILESELFGHKKGSFTGAIESRKGYFEIADGGTLFLDEIAEMPLTTQVKLLRVLETKEFLKLGAETVTKVDVRIIAATNKDLQREVDAKRFREDLYFRLKAVSLTIPPLRKRKAEIEVLAKNFIAAYTEQNKITPPEISQSALELLNEYNWPGNIRELKNTIETAVALNRSGVLEPSSFSSLLFERETADQNRNLPIFLNKSAEDLDRELFYRALFEIKKDLVELKDLIRMKQDEVYQTNHVNNGSGEVRALKDMERDAIINALETTRGNKRDAARMLNISERTLYRKIKEYDLR
ncbi:MAG: sigma-54-dependent Fis family transcriptional regulator [Ignavibacteriales bacterium]|nr:MAG: sigma-54-dependent Fis family transcriptional regulator [Ignavibacteriales bacterium]